MARWRALKIDAFTAALPIAKPSGFFALGPSYFVGLRWTLVLWGTHRKNGA